MSLKKLRKQKNTTLTSTMDKLLEENKALIDYDMSFINRATSSIKRLAMQATHLKFKPAIIQMIQNIVQFYELSHMDPNCHIANFLEICDTFKQTRVTYKVIRLRLFTFSLIDKVKIWLNSLPLGTIKPWKEFT